MGGSRALEARCSRERQWLSLRLDGRLTPFERMRLERHLARCASCRAFEARLAEIIDALRAAPLERPSSPFQVPARRRVTVRLRAALAFATVGLAVAGLSLSGSSPSAPTLPSGREPRVVDDHAKDSRLPVLPGRPAIPPSPIA